MISINFVAGVISLKGTSFTEWIETGFIKVKELVSIPPHTTEDTVQNDDKILPPTGENKNDDTQNTPTEKSEIETKSKAYGR